MRVEVEELQQLSVESQASARRSARLERGDVSFEHLISLVYHFNLLDLFEYLISLIFHFNLRAKKNLISIRGTR